MVESVVEQNFLLSSFHGMISSFHGMIPSYHDMISSYHAVFGLRHRDKSAKVIGLSGQTRGERDSTTDVFSPQTFTMADANVYNGGRKRLRWRMQTFTMADANVYDGGCKRLREKAHSFGESDPVWPISVPRSILQLQRKALGKDCAPALLGLEIYHASNGPLTNGAEDRGLVYLHATFLTGTIDTL